jgi:yeast amino acid transporter
VAVDPITSPEDPPLTARDRADSFFSAYLAVPVVILFWVCGYVWKRSGWLRTAQIDVDTGRREVDWETINMQRARVAQMGPIRRFLNLLF